METLNHIIGSLVTTYLLGIIPTILLCLIVWYNAKEGIRPPGFVVYMLASIVTGVFWPIVAIAHIVNSITIYLGGKK